MIETECFSELNVFGPEESPTPDLLVTSTPPVEKQGCFPFRRKVINDLLIQFMIVHSLNSSFLSFFFLFNF
jgi:hypothetical protein